MMGSDRLAEMFGGKFGSKLDAAAATMQQLDAHIQDLNRTMSAVLDELRRRPLS